MEVMKKLDKLDNKLDQIEERLSSIDVTLVGQAADLKYHIKRTTLAEERMEHIETQLEPIKKHVAVINGVFKFIGFTVSVLGAVAGVAKIFF